MRRALILAAAVLSLAACAQREPAVDLVSPTPAAGGPPPALPTQTPPTDDQSAPPGAQPDPTAPRPQ